MTVRSCENRSTDPDAGDEAQAYLSERADTFISVLRRRADTEPSETAFTFLVDGEQDEESISYSELDRRAKSLAAVLRSRGLEGERALLMFGTGLRFVEAFFGCLYAGVVAVPVSPPAHRRLLPRLQAIASVAGPRLVLTDQEVHARMAPMLADAPEIASLRWVLVDSIRRGSERAWREPAIASKDLAFLQFTSGSTSIPKGVMVTHGNLVANTEMLHHAWGCDLEQASVSWVPLFHDMGLIANLLLAVQAGAECILISPTAFLQRPVRWLQAISRSGARRSGGPNFAFDLCVRKIAPEECKGLELSNWRLAYNGAEPVRHETLKRFAETFGPYGFREEAFRPSYGLAEATVFVSSSPCTASPTYLSVRSDALEAHRVEPAEPTDSGLRTLVGCGTTCLDGVVKIVNPETLADCPPEEVGEIWVSGPHVAQGYWGMEEATELTFGGYIAGTNEGPFLRTGDLGFVYGDDLFVTGRIKDLIIVFGSNHYPQDIELTVERSHPSLRAGRGVAFSVEGDDGEELVVVQEVKQEFIPDLDVEEVRKAIVAAIWAGHDLHVRDVVLACPGSVQKTSSGKLMRRACRALYLEGTVARVEPTR